MRMKSGANSVLERAQRLVDQVAAAAVPHRHVFLACAEVQHVLDRHEPQLLAEPRADLRAAAAELRLLREPHQLRARDARGVPYRARQLLAPHGLQQVADRLRLEGLRARTRRRPS